MATSLVLGPSPAAAQSFNANTVPPVTTNGAVVTTSPGATNIELNAGQTVIDWTPNDTAIAPNTAINFQPGGTATFSSASDFAVLNRINPADPTRSIFLDGTILSLVGGQTGGSVFFYTPGGIVLGPNALINVGSLVLTTSPITPDGSGQFINGTSVTFGNAAPGSSIFTNPFSTINAPNEGSYVAMVAPRIEHRGTINVNGVAALVAAEGATINFRAGGLFDIQIDTGTTDANGVIVGDTGVITGPASTGAGDNHRAYLVAVPKNTALTMLISSGAGLGFDIAGAADVVGNAVVLSAGHDVSFGDTSFTPSAASGALANIDLTNSNFTSALYGRASGEALVGASAGGSSSFASDVSLRAGGKVRFFSDNPGSTVTVAGNLTLSANADGLDVGDSATAGTVQLMASGGGTISVAGSTNLTAIGTGAFSATSGTASGDGTGGTILVQSTTGSNISLGDEVADAFYADASGHGGSFFGTIDGGDGFGGTVNVFTSGGSSMTVAGPAYLTANGIAGQGSDCFQCGGIGGIGDAGTINVQAHTGPTNSMDFADVLYINANGEGGSGQTGGLGLGGDVNVSAITTSSVTVGSDVSISAYGDGGDAFGASGDGGAGFGGDATVYADAGSLDITGSLYEYLDGNGGSSEDGNGGYGEGGFGQLFANNGANVAVGLYTSIYANGYGGDGLASGGEGQGGSAYFSSSNGGTLTLGAYSSLIADGFGGWAYDADGLGGNGGLGEGGHAEAYANNATLDAQGTLVLSADGEGGSAGGLRDAGDGKGGSAYVQAVNGGSLTVADDLYASAIGTGTEFSDATTNSGDGTGGFIGIYARDGDSTLTVGGAANLNADGKANADGECFPCGGIGGVGRGGDIVMSSQGATGLNGNLLDFADLFATASGNGGAGVGGAGGDGFGGTVTLSAADGNAVNVTGLATLEAIGYGGSDFGGFIAGDGFGGTARIITLAGNSSNAITVGSGATVDASGYGGGSDQLANGTGGNGSGGVARLYNPAGTIGIAGDATLNARGYGGDADGATGTGGDGLGKLAEIVSDGGDITIDGSAFVNTSGYGGNGFDSGDGVGGGNFGLMTDGAHIYARNGDISIGFGGVETGAFVESNGTGGTASLRFGGGGSGGDGTGGWASMHSANSNLGPSSVTVQTTYLSATGQGGDGGNGDSGGSGSPGGDGGVGTGGVVIQTAAAGNGLLEIGDSFINVDGYGGQGGDGGSADGGTGGDGGNGGNAFGGFVNVGTESGAPSIAQAGVANFNSITVDASAFGGTGGNGGTSGLPDGNGGNGGSAEGGTAVLIVRGSTLNVGSVGLIANATGGDGGSGAIAGAGGDAESDEVGVIVTERSAGTTRGQLNAGSIIGTVNAVGGSGSTQGLSLAEGGSSFIVRNSDASIGSFDITILADSPILDLATDSISIINGAVTVANDFTFNTPGNLSLFADNGSMTVGGTLTLTAGNFVPDADNEPPVNAGTFFANLINITSDLNIYTSANLDSSLGLNLTAAGFVVAGNLNGNSGDVIVDALGGLIDVGNVTGGFVNLQASDSVTTGDINSDSNIQVTSGADMTLGNLVAGVTIDQNSDKAVHLDADGSILVGDITALGGIDFSASGSMTGGNVITGDVLGGDADGAVTFGTISAGLINPQGPTDDGFSVGFSSGTSISVGDVAGAEGVGFATLGALSTGNITAGTDVLAMASGNMSFGAITAGPGGRTYLADGSMFTAAGGPDNFDASLVFGAAPVASGGSITINGPVSTGSFQAAAASINAGDINASSFIEIFATGGIATGNVDAAGLVFLEGSSVSTGNIGAGTTIALNALTGDLTTGDLFASDGITLDAGGDLNFGDAAGFVVDLTAGGAIDGGNVDSDTDITAVAGTGITLGDLDAGGFDDAEAFFEGSVDLTAGAAIGTGNILAFGDVSLDAGGSIATLDIDADGFVELFAGAGLSAGAINAQAIEASAVGTATLNGIWSAPSVQVTSNDINIATLGGIDAGNTGQVTLQSTNATQALIGDGLTGTGYALSNAEFGRISSGSLFIQANGNASAAQDMLVGDLSITGPTAGSTIDDPNGSVVFDTPGGVIRVVGDVTATGFQAGNGLEFHSELFELDAATGSIAVQGASGVLGGNLEIFADRIHVASGDVLGQLAANPQYAGYQDDLNAPAAVQQPGGVISAANIFVYPVEAVLIQNTGSTDVPAGFVGNNVELIAPEGAPAGSIELIVNGQLVTQSGTLTKIAARDAMVANLDVALFSDNSTINGCALTGACIVVPPEEPGPIIDLPTEFSLTIEDNLPELPFDEDDDESSSPIQPPAALFDTGPLNPDATVDEPISGSGNPALMGAGQPTNSGDDQ